jgi:hypothetical protein
MKINDRGAQSVIPTKQTLNVHLTQQFDTTPEVSASKQDEYRAARR